MKRLKDVGLLGHVLGAWGVALAIGGATYFIATGSAQAQVSVATSRPTWTCSLDGVAASLTRCISNPDSQRAMFVTDIVAQSTTTTGGTWIMRYGTGSNCGTGTASLLPSAASAARLSAPANTAAPLVIQFMSALRVPPGNDICILGVATNTFTGQVSGYYE